MHPKEETNVQVYTHASRNDQSGRLGETESAEEGSMEQMGAVEKRTSSQMYLQSEKFLDSWGKRIVN